MSEETRIWLVESYCPVDMYHCLMPVEYLAEDWSQTYSGGTLVAYNMNYEYHAGKPAAANRRHSVHISRRLRRHWTPVPSGMNPEKR